MELPLQQIRKRLADLGLTPETERYSKISELMLLGVKIGLDADEMGTMVDRIFLQWRLWGELLKVPTSTPPPFAKIAAAPAPKSGGEGDSARVRVLIVEDDPASLIMMESILGSILDRPVYSSVNGQKALGKALEVMPQIVVTDWRMPDEWNRILSRSARHGLGSAHVCHHAGRH